MTGVRPGKKNKFARSSAQPEDKANNATARQDTNEWTDDLK
jgi:hypothetical protein